MGVCSRVIDLLSACVLRLAAVRSVERGTSLHRDRLPGGNRYDASIRPPPQINCRRATCCRRASRTTACWSVGAEDDTTACDSPARKQPRRSCLNYFFRLLYSMVWIWRSSALICRARLHARTLTQTGCGLDADRMARLSRGNATRSLPMPNITKQV